MGWISGMKKKYKEEKCGLCGKQRCPINFDGVTSKIKLVGETAYDPLFYSYHYHEDCLMAVLKDPEKYRSGQVDFAIEVVDSIKERRERKLQRKDRVKGALEYLHHDDYLRWGYHHKDDKWPGEKSYVDQDARKEALKEYGRRA